MTVLDIRSNRSAVSVAELLNTIRFRTATNVTRYASIPFRVEILRPETVPYYTVSPDPLKVADLVGRRIDNLHREAAGREVGGQIDSVLIRNEVPTTRRAGDPHDCARQRSVSVAVASE